jgi:hypothetical protein
MYSQRLMLHADGRRGARYVKQITSALGQKQTFPIACAMSALGQ